MTHLLVRAEHDPIVVVTVEPNRQRQAQLAALGLVAQPAIQPGTNQVQLGLRHRALQAEQQPVVEVGRRVHAVGVGDQRAGQRAQIKQLMPVRRGARQPGDLQREHQPNMTEPDLGDQLLEPDPPVARAPDRPVSSSTTATESAGQPSSTARSLSAYWRAEDSTLRST